MAFEDTADPGAGTPRGTPDPRPRVSLFFPVYHDEHTVRRVTEKALKVLDDVASEYEVIIVDDGSPDRSGEIADALAEEHAAVRVIHHPRNLGYGEAIRTGLLAARYEWICGTDGDDQYEVFDLYHLIRLRHAYDLIITFRYVKVYSGFRIFVSWVYNRLIRVLFRTPYRDISTGLRLVRRSLVREIQLESTSPFVGAELAIRTMLAGHRVGEVGIRTFPREFGRGESVTIPNILATLRDLLRTYRTLYAPGRRGPGDQRP